VFVSVCGSAADRNKQAKETRHYAISFKGPMLHCPPILKVFCVVSSQVIAALDNVILRFKNTGDKILNIMNFVRFGSLSITSK
jgi:hypothetical protein